MRPYAETCVDRPETVSSPLVHEPAPIIATTNSRSLRAWSLGEPRREVPAGWLVDPAGQKASRDDGSRSRLPEPSSKRRRGAWESRHSILFFPLSRHGPAKSSPMAGNADRAVLYVVRRFPARILALGDPPQHRPSGLGEDVRPAPGRLQRRTRLGSPGRSGAGQGGATRSPRLHRGDSAAGGPPPRILTPRPDPGLPAPACRARDRAESSRGR